MMAGEKPGGHGERSVAVGAIDMALWDAVAKIEERPLYRLLADRYNGGRADEQVCVYAAGGYYQPGKDLPALQDEMRGYLDLGYTVVKMKIGGAPLDEDLRRIEAVLEVVGDGEPPGRRCQRPLRPRRRPSPTPRRWRPTACAGTRRRATRSTTQLQAELAEHYPPSAGHGREPLLARRTRAT